MRGLHVSLLWLAVHASPRMFAADAPADSSPAAAPAATARRSTEQLVRDSRASIVTISFSGRDGSREGLGTGIVVDSSGLIATNLHVIGEARPIQVRLHDGRSLDVVAIQAVERSQDLAILKVNDATLKALPLGDSDQLHDGQPIIAIGNPLGLERSVVTGVLSGRREIDNRSMLQLAIPIERGNSGGPVLDDEGRVIGVITLKSLQSQNLGFAAPINALRPLLEKPNPVPMSRWLTIGRIDPSEWTVVHGARWRQRAGSLLVEGMGDGFGGRTLCLSTAEAPSVPFELAVRVKFEQKDGAAGLVFHADGANKHYGFYPSSNEMRLTRFDGPDVYSWKVLRQVRAPAFKPGEWNWLKVRVEAGRIACYVNDVLAIESTDDGLTSGRMGLCKFRSTEAEFRDFQFGPNIASNTPSPESLAQVKDVAEKLSVGRPPTALDVEPLLSQGVSLRAIERQADELERRAARVRELSTALHLRRTLDDLAAELAKPEADFSLGRAALVIARLDNTELDVDGYMAEIDRLAAAVRREFPADAADAVRMAALHRVLFEEYGFHGSRTDYDNRSNSYLNEVIDDREGLPLTLAVLYLELAKRLGFAAEGVGLPGHFVVRVKLANGDPQLIDVFDRGAAMTIDAAKELVTSRADARWTDSYLAAQSSRDILFRMLRNLTTRARSEADSSRMLRYVEAMLVLKPENPDELLFRAALYWQTRRLAEARGELQRLQAANIPGIDPGALRELARFLEDEPAE